MYGADRENLRQVYFDAWQKKKDQQVLSPLEAMIVDVIEWHPEYHPLFDRTQGVKGNGDSDTSAFFHLGLHMAVLEQVQSDRPKGIQSIYQSLHTQCSDPHQVAHKIMECLAIVLKQAFEHNGSPDEDDYLRKLQQLSVRKA